MEESLLLTEAARKGAMKGNCGRMCNDCAFRTGSDANNDLNAVYAALDSLMREAEFHCHTPDFKDTGRMCAGFLYAKLHLQGTPD